ncbi:DNA-binding transcriptional MerR regulator [Actinoalloteichus hoggarensis]|uniref:HTH-type transcriptional regulator AdhR n=1 Tax=Actinoalloteichus hoggarensis TaxID=1470176 RepID=A0A221W5D4_9PSEU|nr:MerR family transcriptional regulator [Actinoalloteichus hoggarensis]ASO21122.1 HTH-type transcriptional regulator AdhR [Actinoalloteichus hoggarensis]MBB5921051.1 DNA-binding transcriptional MerR regulator [Actinoalloteichus hoggarensis]
MTAAPEITLTIGAVSALTGLSTHALRFYEQEGLFVDPVRRNSAGRRLFTEREVGWLRVCIRLRSSGMALPDIRRYAELVREGAGTEAARLQLLRDHEAKVTRQLAELQESLDVIRFKVTLYEEHLAAGSADSLWRDGPSCTPAGSAADGPGTTLDGPAAASTAPAGRPGG